MTNLRAEAQSTYMEWAKLHPTGRFNLSTSGMTSLPLAELGIRLEQLEINGPSIYGYGPLRQSIAARYRVPQESVVSAIGTSFANYLALAASTEAGDEILVEQPAYDPLLGAAGYLGLQVRRFPRPPEQNFALNLEELKRSLTARTRLIVITNLHNPSGVFASDEVMREVARIAGTVGALVLVDEVYREMTFAHPAQTAFHLDPERFIITNSLTKAYGLSGLRCGWILAHPKLAERMWHINDLHGSTFVHPGELLSVIALEKLAAISARMKSLLETNRNLLRAFLDSRNDLDYCWPDYGTVIFPRLRQGNAEEFCRTLYRDFDTNVVPGEFFECPDRFRIGIGTTTEEVRASLEQLGKGLDAFRLP